MTDKERLEEIKERYMEREYDYALSSMDIDWLIQQAERVSELEKQNRGLQITIGKYAGQFQELIGQQQSLCNEGLTITRNMFRTDLD